MKATRAGFPARVVIEPDHHSPLGNPAMFVHKAFFNFRPPENSDEAVIQCLRRASDGLGEWQLIPGYRPTFTPSPEFEDFFTRIVFDPQTSKFPKDDRYTLTVTTDTKLTGFGWAAVILGFACPLFWLLIIACLHYAHKHALRGTDRLIDNLTAECLFAEADRKNS